jgi:uncharacterized RDD family membrane protein YckC
MKCPKCGYLGFETTDRCRNCGYDFSLAKPVPSAELPLRESSSEALLADLALRDGPAEADPAASLHEREAAGFGRPERRRVTPPPASAPPAASAPAPAPRHAAAPDPPAAGAAPAGEDEGAEDLPLFAPRPAGTPLAVRRPGAEVPKARRTTTRPVRPNEPALPLGGTVAAVVDEWQKVARSRTPQVAGLGRRLLAAAIDIVLLLAVHAGVVWLTLRLAGLSPTLEDFRVIPPVPMAAFLLVLTFLYLTGFTVGSGQSIGKMLVGIRVTGDDGRGVDITGAVVRALGCIGAIATLGLFFIPALFGPERRALHDRMAGTRVVVA